MNNINYYQKYLLYKYKYITLKKNMYDSAPKIEIENNQQLGGAIEKYNCNPSKKFIDICEKNNKGKYNSKNKCMNECKNQYINKHLIDAKLKYETIQFTIFIQTLIKKNFTIYIKGGTVLGLYILKYIYEHSTENNFNTLFNEFLKLELIRDWDFVGYSKKKIDDTYKTQLNNMAKKNHLALRAKTFILYQSKHAIKIGDQVLFEIALLEQDDNIGLELPMTVLKIEITLTNLLNIFMLAKSFYTYKTKNQPIDIDFIKYVIKDLNFIVPNYNNGLFQNEKIYTGSLSPPLLKIITNFAKNNIPLQQFLITHIQEPNRLFYRLLEKNIPKVNKINIFFNENKIKNKNTLLIDTTYINNKVESFIKVLGSELYIIYNNGLNNNLSISDIIIQLDELLTGINLNRIQIEYNNISCKGRDLLKILFGRIYNDLIKNKSNLNSKLINLLIFLNKNKLFSE
jgi:hypothetical protein